MALVKITIPGIGEVTAENAATEETLLKLVAAVEKSSLGGGGSKSNTGASGKKEADDLIKSKKDETKAVNDGIDATKKQTKEVADATKQTKESASTLKKTWADMQPGLSQVGNALKTLAFSTAKTAVAIAAQFATMYDDIAENPIQAASGIVATKIDAMGTAATAGIDAIQGVASAAAPLGNAIFPGLGTAISLVIDALGAMAKEAVKLATETLKVANQVMAKEFEKSTAALKSYTAQGASFAGGMGEMRRTANDAGLSIKSLAAISKNATEDIRNMGLTQADGAKKIASGMSAASKTIGKSGGSLRDEMLALGYSYEEQGAVMAQYMAQQKASGNLEKLTSEQIARGTADYAKNLKVISDITGQDAKKLMEKARAESMRGAIMSKLDAKQQESFKQSHSALAALGPEFQNALMQMISGGTVTDPMIAGNAEAMEMIKKVASGVSSGNQDMLNETNKAMSEAAKKTQEQQKNGGGQIDQAVLLMNGNASAAATGFANVANKLSGLQLDPDAAKKSLEAATSQAEATDQTTKAYQKITKDANDMAVQMERLTGSKLGDYASYLATTFHDATDAFKQGISVMQQLAAGKSMDEIAKSMVAKKQAELDAQDKINEQLFKGVEKVEHWGAKSMEKALDFVGLSGLATVMANSRIENETEYLKKEGRIKMAKGGIVEGPDSGFDVTLHGTEAVVPLAGGRSIPVNLSGKQQPSKQQLEKSSTKEKAKAETAKPAGLGAMMDGMLASFDKMAGTDLKTPPAFLKDFSSQISGIDNVTKKFGEDFNNGLTAEIGKLTEIFSKKEESKEKPVKTDNNDQVQLLKEIKEIMSSQMTKHDEMIDKLNQNVDINQRLLTNSYS